MSDRRLANLVAARATLRVRSLDAPELRLVHALLDSWRGIGLIVVGMARQDSPVSSGEHGHKSSAPAARPAG